MCITGLLSDFSLAEICRLLDKGNQTGLLTIETDFATPAIPEGVCYVWLYQGQIVAVANQLDQQCLGDLILKYQWLSPEKLAEILELCPTNKPLGLFLKKQYVLTIKQIKWLFKVQVLQPICALFQLKEAHFQFDHNLPMPVGEMTGLSLRATAATLMGLRLLPNWETLADKLPDPNRGLLSLITSQIYYRLDALELRVWQHTNGLISLKAIAQKLGLSVEKVQQIAFRLIAVGLVEEVPLLFKSPSPPQLQPEPSSPKVNFLVPQLIGCL